ncbi:MAG TPA: carboxylate-amine ligase [Ktedonobacteraceae bacterium]|nr:carboxylate-amine ligase [Ktedonobacteraceae bacterium]
MAAQFSLGIEQEFQLVERQTGNLSSSIDTILAKGAPLLGEKIKAETKQSCVELVTAICPTIEDVRTELRSLHALLTQVVEKEMLALVSAGTHPSALWQDQKTTERERYKKLVEEFQDIEHMLVIYGLHIHVCIEQREIAIILMNQLRTWLPHLLAISTNSPFWEGRYTGLKSFRSALWKPVLRSGLPEILVSWDHYTQYIEDLISVGCIESGKDIYWDIRPHPHFPTLEFRICDMPATPRDTLALAALCQALVTKLAWQQKRQIVLPALPRDYVEENKWQAMRYGLDASIIDFVNRRRIPMRDAIHELLDFIDDVIDDLGIRNEIQYLRTLLDDPRGTGADRQIAIYQQSNDIQKVTQYLIQQMLDAY